MGLKLLGAMHLKTEPSDYHLLRENGQSAINFVHFLSPLCVVIDGLPTRVEKNACILYTPGTRQEYYALGTGFTNNFVTFKLDDDELLRKYNLPLNEVFYIEKDHLVTGLVEYISWTLSDFGVDHTGTVLEHIESLMATLSENQILNTPRAQREYQTKKRLIQLREQVSENPGVWDVEKMAKAMYFTRSYFFLQYRKHFQISPSEDLIGMTLEHAKSLLRKTDASIADISAQCGYKRVEYFIKLFREKVNMTPGHYRKAANDRSRL